jgi:hypothetical protein
MISSDILKNPIAELFKKLRKENPKEVMSEKDRVKAIKDINNEMDRFIGRAVLKCGDTDDK